MAYVTVPKDLTKVKSKVALNLTKRQLVCFGAAAVVGVPLFFLIKDSVPQSAATFIMVLVMLPFFMLAMYDFCAAKGIEKINGRMFRYIYPLTVEAKNILNSYPQYTGLPRPKDKDLYFAVRTGQRQYTQIAQPRFNRDICRYNPQKYGQAERR